MTHANRGKQLEDAIARAFAVYKTTGRAVGEKRYVGNRKVNGKWIPVLSSGVDFSGTVKGGRGLHVEAKETARTAWPLSEISDAEVKHLNKHHAIGALCLLVVEFTSLNETYAIGWEHVAMFLRNPWRESLSLDWCRAFGQLVPNTDGVCLFLDGSPHMAAEECMRAVEAEQVAAFKRPMKPERPAKLSAKRAELVDAIKRPGPTTADEMRARIREAADAGLSRLSRNRSAK